MSGPLIFAGMQKTLVVIGGPTAVGKTTAAIHIARHFGTEIISADSRQVYKELNLGTAKPNQQELDQVKHHFINSHSIHKPLSAGEYEKEANATLKSLFKKYPLIVAVGGSGLYIKAITDGLDHIPETDPEIRTELNTIFEKNGIDPLLKELESADPEIYKNLDLQNPRRVIRALEVYRTTGTPLSVFQKDKSEHTKDYSVLKIGLEMERSDLYQRIESRMDEMIRNGLEDEVRALLPYKELSSLQTLGYSEIIKYLEGKYDYEECLRLLKRNSRRYAKRQMTWFKNQEDMVWFKPKDLSGILTYINSVIPH